MLISGKTPASASLAFILIAFLALGACSPTRYDAPGFPGALASNNQDGTYRVVGRGNVYTDAETTLRYAMLKAAETSLDNGAQRFQIVKAWVFGRSDVLYGARSGHILQIKLLSQNDQPDPDLAVHDAEKIKAELTPLVMQQDE